MPKWHQGSVIVTEGICKIVKAIGWTESCWHRATSITRSIFSLEFIDAMEMFPVAAAYPEVDHSPQTGESQRKEKEKTVTIFE